MDKKNTNSSEEIAVQISLNALRGEILIQTKNRGLERFLRDLLSIWTPNLIKSRGILDESDILLKIENQLLKCSWNGFRIKNFLIQKL